jgi:hypothetical protein
VKKNKAYNYNFVSLKKNKEVIIQPEKEMGHLFYSIYQYHSQEAILMQIL